MVVDLEGKSLEFVNTFGSSVNLILSWVVCEYLVSVIFNNAFAVGVWLWRSSVTTNVCTQLTPLDK